jgi:hypothetical protein
MSALCYFLLGLIFSSEHGCVTYLWNIGWFHWLDGILFQKTKFIKAADVLYQLKYHMLNLHVMETGLQSVNLQVWFKMLISGKQKTLGQEQFWSITYMNLLSFLALSVDMYSFLHEMWWLHQVKIKLQTVISWYKQTYNISEKVFYINKDVMYW